MKKHIFYSAKYLLCCTIFILAASFFPSGNLSAHVEKIYYLKGTIGGKEMAMKIYCYDEMETRYANYFLTNEKSDRYLKGNLINGYWEFKTTTPGDSSSENPQKEVIYIAEKENGMWEGYMTDAAGHSLPIQLTNFENDSIPSKFAQLDYVKELDPYERFRIAGMKFIKTKKERKARGIFCEWYEEVESGISFFRIKQSRKLPNTEAVNQTLEAIHLALLKHYFSFNPDKKALSFSTEIKFINEQLISFKTTSQMSFHTLPTSSGRQLTTLDMDSGYSLSLEDLLWLDENTTASTDLSTVYEYRKSTFAEKILLIMKENYPEKMNSSGCEYYDPKTWQLVSWGLTKKGIALGSLVKDECDMLDWAIIPFKSLKPYWINEKYFIK